jgi:hypothetical protein
LHEGRLWVIEQDPDRLTAFDPQSGERLVTVDLPGPGGGLAIEGSVGFVTTSHPFSGVSIVDLAKGELGGYLRFEAEIPEVCDVTVVPHRYPEIVGSY